MKGKIHSAIPAGKEDKVNNAIIKRRIKTVVLPEICGRKKAMVSDRIAMRIGIQCTQTNQGIRKVMKELLIEENIPVIACADGFFIAKKPEELDEYILTTERRMAGLIRNLNALYAIREKLKTVETYQQKLFNEDD